MLFLVDHFYCVSSEASEPMLEQRDRKVIHVCRITLNIDPNSVGNCAGSVGNFGFGEEIGFCGKRLISREK